MTSSTFTLDYKTLSKSYTKSVISTLQVLERFINLAFKNPQKYGTSYEGDIYVYNSASHIASKTNYSEGQVRRALKVLIEDKLIIVKKLNPKKFVNYYTLNRDILKRVGGGEEIKTAPTIDPVSPTEVLKNTTAQSMLLIWNKTFPDKAQKISKPLAQYLVAAFNTSFERDLTKWQAYCESLHHKSPFLSLQEALKFRAINTYLRSQSSKLKKVYSSPSNKNSLRFKGNEHTNLSTIEISLDSSILEAMLTIWHDYFGKKQENLTLSLQVKLQEAYKTLFQEDLDEWNAYCKTLSSSSYLTGDNFNLCLSSVLNKSFREKVMNKELGIKQVYESEKKQQRKEEEKNLQLEKHFAEKETIEHPFCLELRKKFLKEMGREAYLSFLNHMTLLLKDGKLNLEGDPWACQHLENSYPWIFSYAKEYYPKDLKEQEQQDYLAKALQHIHSLSSTLSPEEEAVRRTFLEIYPAKEYFNFDKYKFHVEDNQLVVDGLKLQDGTCDVRSAGYVETFWPNLFPAVEKALIKKSEEEVSKEEKSAIEIGGSSQDLFSKNMAICAGEERGGPYHGDRVLYTVNKNKSYKIINQERKKFIPGSSSFSRRSLDSAIGFYYFLKNEEKERGIYHILQRDELSKSKKISYHIFTLSDLKSIQGTLQRTLHFQKVSMKPISRKCTVENIFSFSSVLTTRKFFMTKEINFVDSEDRLRLIRGYEMDIINTDPRFCEQNLKL